MKTPLRRLLASILLCAPLLAAAAPAPLTPEQAFDLYARALLEDDAAATRRLNEALKPAFDGQDMLPPAADGLAKVLSEPWLRLLASTDATVDPAAAEAMYATALRGSQCRATHSRVEDDTGADAPRSARIDFSCQMPDLDSVRPVFAASMRADDPAARMRFTEAYTKALLSGPRRTVAGMLTLYSAKDKGGWYTDNFDDLMGPVLRALAPFGEWIEDAEAAKAPKVTGVPACDLLLQQHRHCVAKIAPDQLNGVDVMADELKLKAAQQSAAEMTQECRALRRIAERMWTDACV